MIRDWLDNDPPEDPSLKVAYWCEMDYFMVHTATGDHPPCQCPPCWGHNHPDFHDKRRALESR